MRTNTLYKLIGVSKCKLRKIILDSRLFYDECFYEVDTNYTYVIMNLAITTFKPPQEDQQVNHFLRMLFSPI